MSETQLAVQGMTCASCVRHVEKALLKVPGVTQVEVNLATEKARVFYEAEASVEAMIQAVVKDGYEAQEIRPEQTSTGPSKEAELADQLKQVQLAAMFSLPLLLPMLWMPLGIHWAVPPWGQFLLATPVQFWLGRRFYIGAYKAIKSRNGNMDLLVALGTSAAYGLSVYHLLQGAHAHALYFESAAVVMTLVLLGKWLEARAKAQTSDAIRALESLRPERARIRQGDQEVELPLNQIKVGDLLLIRAGERIPVDAEIVSGQAMLDESMLTGESWPVSKGPQDPLIGGSVNLDGYLEARAQAVGTETMLAKVIRMVESAQSAKAPIQQLVDKVSAVFVPVVLVIALITLFGWMMAGLDFEHAMINAVAVLVIACPCALGLATPAAIMVGMGLGARNGILIKDAQSLEITHAINTVAFDKTGTLTQGQPDLVNIWSPTHSSREVLAWLTALQQGSNHPLAQAVLRKARLQNVSSPAATGLKILAGRGVQGQVKDKSLILGNQRLMQESGIDLNGFDTEAQAALNQGLTLSYLADTQHQKLIAMVAFADQIKSSALATLDALHQLGIQSVLITGDHPQAAQRVAQELGIDQVYAEVLPADKAQIVKDLQAQGRRVAMVGDGINDAPALAAADVGFAMATGTDVAMQAAGITLMRGEPLLIPDAIDISRRTYAKIRQNLFWAFIYNLVGIPLAALGLLNPMLAGAAMAFSSVSVISNALLLRRWRSRSRDLAALNSIVKRSQR